MAVTMYHSLFIFSILHLTAPVNIASDFLDQNETKATVIELSSPNVTALIENFKKSWPVKEWILTGLFSEEYIIDINPHWLSYTPPTLMNFYVVAALYLIIMTVGVTGNILVIFLFFR